MSPVAHPSPARTGNEADLDVTLFSGRAAELPSPFTSNDQPPLVDRGIDADDGPPTEEGARGLGARLVNGNEAHIERNRGRTFAPHRDGTRRTIRLAGDNPPPAPPVAELARNVVHGQTIHRRTRWTRADDARSFTPCQRQLLARRRSASDDLRRARDLLMRNIAYIALGSNLGDRDAHLAHARAALAALPESRLLAVSAIEETEPLGGAAQGLYLNQMAAVETALEPHALLAALQRVERDAGRVRDERWGARTLDLDIVKFANHEVSDPDLTIPHPGLERREFWRRELAELGGAS